MINFSLSRRAMLAGAALAATGLGARAQSWPAKPVRIIVAGPPGASADLAARIMADPLAKDFGQPVVVDDKPGGAGAIAVTELMRAPRDGHTLMVGVSSLVSEIPHVIKLPWDMGKEIRPLAELARGGLVLVANPSFPANNLKELIAYAKTKPGQVAYASYSPGTLSHVEGLLLNQAAGIELIHVGYKGSTPALQDVMGNHVPLMFDSPPTSIPMIKSGKIKAFAVSTPQRLPQLPDVPTFHELGFPQLDALAWLGLWCTPDVPAPVQERVRAAALKALGDPSIRKQLLDTGFDVGQPRSVDDMQKGLLAEYKRVGGVLQSIGFKPE